MVIYCNVLYYNVCIVCHVPFLQVEPNTKLFPAVFVLPSSQNMIQFELGKLKVSHKESQSAPILKIETNFGQV